jgi:carbamoyl-phosphate synthase large subunit
MELAEEGFLEKFGVRLLGANPETIKKAEDRLAFKETMLEINEPCVASEVVESVDDAVLFAKAISYPVIVRPAYTLGGTGGGIAYTKRNCAISPKTACI